MPSDPKPVERWFSVFDHDSKMAVFWIANAIIAILVRQSALLATGHAALVSLITLYIAITSRRSEYLAYALAFVVGSEVLWRMSKASVFYEISKHSTTVFCLIGLARLKVKRIPLAAIIYFVVLVPGAVTTIMMMPWGFRLYKMLAFNLSGPLAMAMAICFFSNIKLTPPQVWRVLIILITAILGIAAVSVFWVQTATEEELSFNTESNKTAAGGFGPNQVSATLGLGAGLSLLLLAQRMTGRRRLLLSGALLVCIMQSALTFSRSGLYAAAGSFCMALIFLLRRREFRARLAYLGAAGAAVAIFVVIPYLVAFTGGAIAKRFSDKTMTGREDIILTDVRIWKQNPIYGVGVGVSGWYHHNGLTAHNEFSRLVAEHGAFGLIAIITLLGVGLQRLLVARTPLEKAFVAVAFTWPMLFMMVNGFRIAAPAFVLGLGCVRFRYPETSNGALRPTREISTQEEEVYR